MWVILGQNPKESRPAYARVSEEFKAEFAGSRPASARSIDEIHSSLDWLAKRCKVEAQSYDEWAVVDLFIVKLQTNHLSLATCGSISVLWDLSSCCLNTLSAISMWPLFSELELVYCKSQVTYCLFHKTWPAGNFRNKNSLEKKTSITRRILGQNA